MACFIRRCRSGGRASQWSVSRYLSSYWFHACWFRLRNTITALPYPPSLDQRFMDGLSLVFILLITFLETLYQSSRTRFSKRIWKRVGSFRWLLENHSSSNAKTTAHCFSVIIALANTWLIKDFCRKNFCTLDHVSNINYIKIHTRVIKFFGLWRATGSWNICKLFWPWPPVENKVITDTNPFGGLREGSKCGGRERGSHEYINFPFLGTICGIHIKPPSSILRIY